MNNQALSGPIRELIESDLRRGSLSFVIARRYGTTTRVVDNIKSEIGLAPSRGTPEQAEQLLEFVKPGLRNFVVQIKPACVKWRVDPKMREIRALYDEGFVDLCTGRIKTPRGDFLVLYSIPRKLQDKARRRYFSVMYEG